MRMSSVSRPSIARLLMRTGILTRASIWGCVQHVTIWELGRLIGPQRAIALLSDARIVKENTSKILETLSLSQDPAPLILKYARTCKPALTLQEDLERFFLAMAEYNLMEAWQFQRTFSAHNATRRQLLHKFLEWTMTRSFLWFLPQFNELTRAIS